MKTVVVAVSGGVDSSVSAFLLQNMGYNVIGVYMKNWTDNTSIIDNECPWVKDSLDALLVCDKLNIPFHIVDFSKEYENKIVNYMIEEYSMGKTPNPDVLCNKYIKFDLFLKFALNIGADYIATGHYARVVTDLKNNKKIYKIFKAIDINKDQSYFLCRLSQYQLSKSIFPLGQIKKDDVRKLAKDIGLITAEKKDSQGLCFVGKIKLVDFLGKKLLPQKGKIILISKNWEGYVYKNNILYSINNYNSFYYKETDGKVIGYHKGVYYYTIGQRRGIKIGGMNLPLFVISIDINKNILYVGEGSDHPGLYSKSLFIKHKDVHWVRPNINYNIGHSIKVQCMIRYRQKAQNAYLYILDTGISIIFEKEQFSITKGQFCVWYKNDELIGSGIIF